MFEHRALEPELMDRGGFGHSEVLETFQFIEPVNRWLGGSGPLLAFFTRESRNWTKRRIYRLLDVGCGAGDIPRALIDWARQRGYSLRIEAIDSNPITADLARRKCRRYPEISVTCADMFSYDGPKVDYVSSSMLLHHFCDQHIPAVLQRLLDLCQGKVIVNDLVRARTAYWGTWLFTLIGSAVVRHDARLSVRKGFTLIELERLLKHHAFQNFRLERHFFYRFLLILNKGDSS